MTLLWLTAERAAIYRALRTSLRPPEIMRFPSFLPLSLLRGLIDQAGNFWRSAFRVRAILPGVSC